MHPRVCDFLERVLILSDLNLTREEKQDAYSKLIQGMSQAERKSSHEMVAKRN